MKMWHLNLVIVWSYMSTPLKSVVFLYTLQKINDVNNMHLNSNYSTDWKQSVS